ncbi:MAG: HAD-IA family hydrolase [Candidatus Binatia bacterium]
MKLERPVSHAIYDLDGVLLDTEPLYTRVTQAIVGEYGKTFDWSIKKHMIGRPSIESARYLVNALELPIAPEEYLDLRRDRLNELFLTTPAKPGAERFSRAVQARSVRQAIATSSERVVFEYKRTSHAAWFSMFSVVVTGDDPRVGEGKPAPDIFLVAAAEIGAAPGDCVVFEDSPAGVEAALAAGMQVVALPDPELERERFAGADLIIDSFDDLEPADIGL